MDPDEALTDIRLLVAKDQAPGESLDPHEVERLVELVAGLDQWMARGGPLPRDWATVSRPSARVHWKKEG